MGNRVVFLPPILLGSVVSQPGFQVKNGHWLSTDEHTVVFKELVVALTSLPSTLLGPFLSLPALPGTDLDPDNKNGCSVTTQSWIRMLSLEDMELQ